MAQRVSVRSRILLVEDHEPFRDFIRSQIQQRPNLQIICEVTDGLEAVQRAEELQPELVFLDIGLPTLDGFEVARRMSTVAPRSKIIFVTIESSHELVRTAFKIGARGYVLKSDSIEILAATDTVLRGGRFLSSGLSQCGFAEAADD